MTSLRPAFSGGAAHQPSRMSDPQVKQSTTDEFISLPLARAYIDTVREEISSFSAHQLIDALECLDRAYRQFPELALDRPHGELVEALQSAAKNMPDRTSVLLLIYCLASGSAGSSSVSSLVERIAGSDGWQSLSPILRMLGRSREVCWDAIRPIVKFLGQRDRADMLLPAISELFGSLTFANKASASDLGDILKPFLTGEPRSWGDSYALAKAMRSARRRLTRPALRQNAAGSGAILLAMAERLRPALTVAQPNPGPDLAWPSDRMSFDEFLLQWPCEVQLPDDLDDAAFIAEAYQAILLRPPEIAERSQYLRLMKDGVVAKSWIIEDLLASEEFFSLERRLRVVCDGHVITGPGSTGEEDMPAVTWPSSSVD